MQLWSKQWELFLDPLKLLPPNRVATEHLIEKFHLFLDRQVPHPSHLVLQAHERAAQP
jgi:hypothetical protein